MKGATFRTRATIWAATLGLVALTVTPAQGAPARNGAGLSGQPGVVRTASGVAAIPGSWTISVSGSYGWQPELLVEGDAAHGTWARLALSYAPWSFLQIAASIDQTISLYDQPGDDIGGLVVGSLGDARVSLRSGWDLGRGFSIALLGEVFFPTSMSGVSFVGSSISPRFDLAVTFAPERVPLGVHLQLGYRHDRTSEISKRTQGLREEELALSGATASLHHLAVGLGVEYRFGPVAPFAELTGDIPLDNDGPAHSWLLVGLGARLWLGPEDAVRLTLALEVGALRGEPDVTVGAGEVWETPPLVNVLVGVAVRLPIRAEASAEPGDEPVDPGPAGGEPVEAEPEVAAPGRIAGRVLCGEVPCRGASTVEVAGTGASPYVVREGAFVTTELAPGTYRLTARLGSAEEQTREIAVAPGATAEVTFTFAPGAEPITGIRGQVTDFDGTAVQAVIRIPNLDLEIRTDEEGRFQVETEPGTYQIIAWSRGYRARTARVEVTSWGMEVVNIQLER